MKKKLFAATFAIACGIGFSYSALAQSIQVQATNVNTQDEEFDLSIGGPKVVLNCLVGANNVHDLWVANGASAVEAGNAFDSYYDNCMCASGKAKYCN